MPNVKVYFDEATLDAGAPARLRAGLPGLRAMLCEELKVTIEACQIGLLPVAGLGQQPPVSAELALLPRPERSVEKVREVAGRVRALLAEMAGAPVAVRIVQLDPATYVVLK